MKGFLLSTLAALGVVACASHVHRQHHESHASHFTYNNGTHVVDPQTKQTIQRFGCDVHKGKASEHFLQTIKKLRDEERAKKVGTRAASPMMKRKLHAQNRKKQPTSSTRVSSKSSPSSTASTTTSSSSSTATNGPQLSITVPTYFHIISSTAHNGTITPAMVSAQAQTLNSVYNQYGIHLNVVNTSWTVNDVWAIGNGNDLNTAKEALRIGTYANLNLFFHTDLAGGNLGTCTLPTQLPPNAIPSQYSVDGCDVNANTMPGGNLMGYNKGMTAVHETGHWFGLLHTFEGYTCSGDGDYVDDTRQEAQSTDGCPISPPKNTCPQYPGVDPIHNIMDYSTDACYEGFTPDQVSRMDSLWSQYRKGH